MNLLVTGGCGFIGSNFVRQRLLADEPEAGRIVNLDKLTYAGNPANLADLAGSARYRFVHGDIGDEALVARLLAEESIGAIVNFAAESHVDRSIDTPEPFIQTNVVGTLRLLQAARKYWTGLPADRKEAFRFLHVSTDEVYGTLAATDPAFTEETPFAPNSPYAASKAASDHLVRSYQHTFGLPTLTTNCSNNYGPYQFPEKLIPLMILNAMEDKPLPVYGNGTNVRDWIHVEDHCDAVARVLEAGKDGEVYNIGGRSERTNLEIVRAILSELGKPESLIEYVTDRPGHDQRYAIDDHKIERQLGWVRSRHLDEGLASTVKWYRDNATWVNEVRSGDYRHWYERNYGAR
jgi:dTDP-glucose 4,6-dehydratase